MGKKNLVLILAALLLSGCSLPGFLRPKYGALQVTTKPSAEVFLNDKKLGETPFKSEKLKTAEYKLKLVPKEGSQEPWETAITLQSNITTAVNYEFGEDRQHSAGEILSLEKLADTKATIIAVVSIPDNASVKIDGQPKGFTPAQIKDIPPGDHVLTITAPGYKQRRIEIKLVEGYKLMLDVQLAKEELEGSQEATPSAEPQEKEESPALPLPTPTKTKSASPSAALELPYVEILDTPTGWLKVRSSPTTVEDNEITKVNPGETYPFLESNDTGWHKIRLSDGQEGWISGRYAKVYK